MTMMQPHCFPTSSAPLNSCPIGAIRLIHGIEPGRKSRPNEKQGPTKAMSDSADACNDLGINAIVDRIVTRDAASGDAIGRHMRGMHNVQGS